jgi:hypothetical protein
VTRLSILVAGVLLGQARDVRPEERDDLAREIAWARRTWPAALKGVRFESPVAKLLAWVPPGASIQVWAYSPELDCAPTQLWRNADVPPANRWGGDLLAGKAIIEQKVRRIEGEAREVRSFRLFTMGAAFAQSDEAIFLEQRDEHGSWQWFGTGGTIGRDSRDYGVLTRVDADAAWFGGEPVTLHVECVGPVTWLRCRGGGEHPCVGCAQTEVIVEETIAYYSGMGFEWRPRRVSCHESCPRNPPSPAKARLDALQGRVNVWRPSEEPRELWPALHRSLIGCLRAHHPDGEPQEEDIPAHL